MTSRFGPAQAGLLIAALSAASVLAALAFEHVGGLAPCPLCLQQRLAYYAAIPLGIGVAVLIAAKLPQVARLALIALALAMLFNAGLGVYHAGAEYGFWPGPASCAASGNLDLSGGSDLGGNLAENLRNTQIVPCDQAAWTLGGVSLAGFSVMMSLGLALVALIGATADIRRSPDEA